ncbi:hypothetical protein B0I37DRAFT_213615 [Chaetomium sp. MPI-CAGE-AT-0009]|nr:hypothetical protein B0I37DRAFT_213615 [Chaetomium sp. MPI-CAGE-AT-0009]
MRTSKLLAAVAVIELAAAGFATYKEIRSDIDNSDAIAYYELDRSDTLFLYIQIIAGGDHQPLIEDFKTLARNYGSQGVSAIPRVRYGNVDGSVASEPADAALILDDVATWATAFSEVSGIIDIPVIQVGFLGLWGEWHSGHFCPEKGIYDTLENREVKKAIVDKLREVGPKVAMRYPQDHKALYDGDRGVTIHNDCIFNAGPKGTDGGTFPVEDRETWVSYTKEVASNNTYGGEPCDQASDSTFDWTNFAEVCGSNGLEAYIREFEFSYLNPGNPPAFQQLFNDPSWADCVDAIGAALDSYL